MTALLVVWAVCVGAAWYVGGWKGRPKAGFLCGVFLGIIGVAIAAFLRSSSELDNAGAHYIDMPRRPQKWIGESQQAFEARQRGENVRDYR